MKLGRRQYLQALLALAVAPGVFARQGERQYLVGFAQDTLSNDFRAAQVRQLAERFSRIPSVNFVFSDADGQTAKQIADIEEFVARKVDLLIVAPRDAKAMTPVITDAHRRGIPVVLLTRRIEGEGYTCLVGPDDEHIGELAAEFMAKRLRGKGAVMMLEGVPTASTAIARGEGFRRGLRKHPGIRLVATKVGNYLRGDAIRAMEEMLSSGLHFDGLFAQSDSMASGARLALIKAGIPPASKTIIGIDYIAEARKAILEGEQTASFVYPLCAEEAVEVSLAILRGNKVPRRRVVASRLVTQGEARSLLPIF
ncbi:substrate-binding domain-containing protein [Azonexus sp. IMCC34839]|uniref:substrate-binding domain-containing protein n=1 Tax=Azonexus sp. IMCC34839 TaxID=3133695 RepID=UPI003999EF20